MPLSLLSKTGSLGPNAVKQNAESILVLLMGRLGDTLVALPALHAIRSEHPQSQIHLVCQYSSKQIGAGPAELLENIGLVDFVIKDVAHASVIIRTLSRIWLAILLQKRWKAAYILTPPHPPCTDRLLKKFVLFAKLCGARMVFSPQKALSFQYDQGKLLPLPHVSTTLCRILPNVPKRMPAPLYIKSRMRIANPHY
jgi:hypothetical protein